MTTPGPPASSTRVAGVGDDGVGQVGVRPHPDDATSDDRQCPIGYETQPGRTVGGAMARSAARGGRFGMQVAALGTGQKLTSMADDEFGDGSTGRAHQ